MVLIPRLFSCSAKCLQHSIKSAISAFLLLTPLLLVLTPEAALAAEVPDAGRLLREQPKVPPTLPGSPAQRIAPEKAEQVPVEAGPKVLVKGFRIEGASLIPVADLEGQVQSAIGKELSFAQLRAVAESLVAYYAQQGYLAQAVLPPQDIEGGIVLIQITEGKRGGVQINNQGKRADSARIQGFIDYRLAQGEPMNLEALGEAVNILNEQPGIEVKTTLKPGAAEGETGLVVNVTEKPFVNFNLATSNSGSRGTGLVQGIASATLNNPLGLFDAATFMVTKSEGSTFGMLDYSLAVGNSGLRAGVNLSRMVYNVTQEGLSAADPHGTATTGGIRAEYPLYRRAEFSLSVTGNLDTKHLRDATSAGETGNRDVSTATLGLNGKRVDNFFGGGETNFGTALVVGHSKEDNAAAVATDRASRDALGGFSKIKFNLDRQQKLLESLFLVANLRGQIAFDNQDSTERFSLGGADAIRAFPSGEGGGDNGWVLSLNLVRPFNDNLRGTLFLDTGGVRLNQQTWAGWNAGNPGLENHYQLSGYGVALDWQINPYFALTATVAAKLGGNPGHDVNGKDTDGTDQSVRGWINLVGQF